MSIYSSAEFFWLHRFEDGEHGADDHRQGCQDPGDGWRHPGAERHGKILNLIQIYQFSCQMIGSQIMKNHEVFQINKKDVTQ